MRAKIEAERLLTIVLLLVVVWLALVVINELLSVVGSVFALLPNLLGVAIIIVIALWWFEYI